MNNYSDWIIDEPLARQVETPGLEALATPEPIQEKEKRRDKTVKGKTKKFPVVIPYVKRASENLRRVFYRYGVPYSSTPSNTLRQLLVLPKDKIQK